MKKASKSIDDLPKHNTLLHNRWKVLEQIGTGTNTVVFNGYDQELEKEVAVKVIRSYKTNLDQEARILKKLKNHDHFCEYIYHEFSSKINFLVIELVGPSIRQLKRKYGYFSLSTVLYVGIQMLESIQILHDLGYAHCDIKPSNFAIGSNNKRKIYLLDFDLAENCDSIKQVTTFSRKKSKFKGTLKYASPQALKGNDMDKRDDLWGLLYTLISCRSALPWAEDNDTATVLRKKEQRINYLMQLHLSSDFLAFKEHLESLEFRAQPNYKLLKSCFSKALERFEISDNGDYDWEGFPRRVWKGFRTQSTQVSNFITSNSLSWNDDEFEVMNFSFDGKNLKCSDNIDTTSNDLSSKSSSYNDAVTKTDLSMIAQLGNVDNQIFRRDYIVAYNTFERFSSPDQNNSIGNSSLVKQNPNLFFDQEQASGSNGYVISCTRNIGPPSVHPLPTLRLVEIEQNVDTKSVKTQSTESISDSDTDDDDEIVIIEQLLSSKIDLMLTSETQTQTIMKGLEEKSKNIMVRRKSPTKKKRSNTAKPKNKTNKNNYLLTQTTNTQVSSKDQTQAKKSQDNNLKGKMSSHSIKKTQSSTSSLLSVSSASSASSVSSSGKKNKIINQKPSKPNVSPNQKQKNTIVEKTSNSQKEKRSTHTVAKTKGSTTSIVTSASTTSSSSVGSNQKKSKKVSKKSNKAAKAKSSSSKLVKKNSSTVLTNQQLLKCSSSFILLPDKKKHLVPPKPEPKAVYKPKFESSLVSIPEGRMLELCSSSSLERDFLHHQYSCIHHHTLQQMMYESVNPVNYPCPHCQHFATVHKEDIQCKLLNQPRRLFDVFMKTQRKNLGYDTVIPKSPSLQHKAKKKTKKNKRS